MSQLVSLLFCSELYCFSPMCLSFSVVIIQAHIYLQYSVPFRREPQQHGEGSPYVSQHNWVAAQTADRPIHGHATLIYNSFIHGVMLCHIKLVEFSSYFMALAIFFSKFSVWVLNFFQFAHFFNFKHGIFSIFFYMSLY